MLDADRVSRLLDLHQSRSVKRLREMAFANASEVGLVDEVGVELARCIPERADRASAAGVVPDGRRHDPALPGHATISATPAVGSSIRQDHQLRQGRVELRVLERQLLSGSTTYVDARMTFHRGDKGSDG